MVTSSEKAKKYIPNPFEAQALKELKQPWRFYNSKEDFEKKVAEYKKQKIQTAAGEVDGWQAAQANALISFGAELSDYKEETLAAAESQIRSDKKLWKKIQAAHLYNTLGIKPEINQVDSQDLGSADIMQKIGEYIDKMEKGSLVDGKYVPSKAEKNLLRTLGDYGEFIRNPKSADETSGFAEELKKRLERISKRDIFLEPQKKKEKQPKKDQRKDNNMSDENKYELTDEQKEFCKAHNIDPAKITSEEDYKKAVENAGKEHPDNTEEKDKNKEKPDTEKTTDANENKTAGKDGEENTNDAKPDDKTTALGVHIGTPKTDENSDEKEPDWVKKKAEYYAKLAADGKIQGYEQIEPENKQVFAAKLENAEIHYSSPNDVTVSADAGFKVFDTMLKEPDNKGRPIEFPDNASKEVATRLYAACVLNGNKMQGAVPTEIDMDELAKCGLSAEQIKQVQDYYEASKNKDKTNANTGAEKQEEKHVEEPQLSDKTKADIQKISEIKKNFEQMKQDGKIAIQKGQDGKPQIVAGEKGTEEDVKNANAIMKEAADLVKAGLSENRGKDIAHDTVKLEAQQQKDTNTIFREQQRDQAESLMTKEQLDTHRAKVEERLQQHAARLGMLPEGVEVKDKNGKKIEALKGDELKKYQSQLQPNTLAAIKQKFGKTNG